jgi:predicted permease
VPNDNDDEVGARGILYLLIFQQLGQLLRWSWGYNVLLAPAERYTEADGGTNMSRRLEQGPGQYRDDPEVESHHRLLDNDYDDDFDDGMEDDEETRVGEGSSGRTSPGAKTPTNHARGSTRSSRSTSPKRQNKLDPSCGSMSASPNDTCLPVEVGQITSFPSMGHSKDVDEARGLDSAVQNFWQSIKAYPSRLGQFLKSTGEAMFLALPQGVQTVATRIYRTFARFMCGLWAFMNPPLWAMLAAIIVASVPALQNLFFNDDTIIYNSVTRAVTQSAGVAVPAILVVLGGNLARYAFCFACIVLIHQVLTHLC